MTAQYPPVPPPGYGPNPYGYGPPPRRAANPLGIVVTLLGGVTVLAATLVDWYRGTSVEDLVGALQADGAPGFPKAGFSWLMWVLLAATVVAALFANLPGGVSPALRVVAPVLGAAGAVVVFAGLDDLVRSGSVFDNAELGLYLTLLGFVVAGVGGIFGPRRVS